MGRDAAIVSITVGAWKYVHGSSGAHQLYDLDADPLELDNVAAEHPDQVARLKRFLDERQAMRIEPPENAGDAIDTEALKALGYTDVEDEGE